MADFGPKPASDSAQSQKIDDFHGKIERKREGAVEKKGKKTDGVREENLVEPKRRSGLTRLRSSTRRRPLLGSFLFLIPFVANGISCKTLNKKTKRENPLCSQAYRAPNSKNLSHLEMISGTRTRGPNFRIVHFVGLFLGCVGFGGWVFFDLYLWCVCVVL